jgi:hypothetical protein
VLHLSRKYEVARIEAACARALLSALPPHGNVRGSDYYH